MGVDGSRWKLVAVGGSESEWVGAWFSKTNNKICLDIFSKNKTTK